VKKNWLAVFLILYAGMVTAQVNVPDSIRSFIEQKPKDSAYLVALNNLAFSYLKSNPFLGRDLATQSILLTRQIGFTRGYARALAITGSSYWVVGDYESALDYYQLSARESEAIKDTINLVIAYNNMGEVYKKIQDYEKSVELLSIALDWYTKLKQPHAIIIYNIGEDYLFMNRLQDALNFFNRSLSQAMVEKDSRTIAYTYQGLGLIKHRQKEDYQALAYLTKAEIIWRSQGEIRSLIQTYQDFGDIFLALNQIPKAFEYIDQATILATQIQAADLQIINYQKQATLYNLTGEYKKAVGVLQKYNTIKDSVYNLKKTEQIARLQTLFDTESRDIENQQLKAEQTAKSEQIRIQQLFLLTTTLGLLIAGIMTWVLFRQRKKILEVNNLLNDRSTEINRQKEEIQSQAQELSKLNGQLQTMNRSLEDRIEERTHLLRRQNEKLAGYAHVNAHLLRAPIVSILGLLNLIEKIQLPSDDQVLIRHLQRCGQDLDRITREINRNLEEEGKI
jgi:tetratricopeptide (TPR) repeat protein